jgi:hypothetical protein
MICEYCKTGEHDECKGNHICPCQHRKNAVVITSEATDKRTPEPAQSAA